MFKKTEYDVLYQFKNIQVRLEGGKVVITNGQARQVFKDAPANREYAVDLVKEIETEAGWN